MYRLEIFDGVIGVETLLYIVGEEMEIRDKIDHIKSIGLQFKLWKEVSLDE